MESNPTSSPPDGQQGVQYIKIIIAVMALVFLFLGYRMFFWLPGDDELTRAFRNHRRALETLSLMAREDRLNTELHASYDSAERADRLKQVGIDEARWQAYRKLLEESEVTSITYWKNGEGVHVDFFISWSLGQGSTRFLHSQAEMEPCMERITEVAGGIPVSSCVKMDEHWYLFHHS